MAHAGCSTAANIRCQTAAGDPPAPHRDGVRANPSIESRRPAAACRSQIFHGELGRLDYAAGLRLQQKLVELRKAGQIGDALLLLERTPVITLGRNANAANVLASSDALAARGVEVFECDRGGDVTFHGPGQLVGYPIFDLRGHAFRARAPAPHRHARADTKAVHAVGDVREDVLHPGTDARLRSVTSHLGFAQRLIAIPFLMDLALHSTLLQVSSIFSER